MTKRPLPATVSTELIAMAMLWNPEWVISPQEAWATTAEPERRRLMADAQMFLRALRGGR